MSNEFSISEWSSINSFLRRDNNAELYGFPRRTDESIIFSSWNIRKFGKFRDGDKLSRTNGSSDLIAEYCRQCDLVALQEVQEDTSSLDDLLARLNSGSDNYGVLKSDVTGKAPGYDGMAERFCFIYNRDKIDRGDLASDITLDRSAVIHNIKKAHRESINGQVPNKSDPSFVEKAGNFFNRYKEGRALDKTLKHFSDFIRSPHIAEFVVRGADHTFYTIFAVNAHLVSGKSKKEREREFFALLEWLLIQSEAIVTRDKKVIMILGDLNLDFKSNVSKRKQGIEEYITSLNHNRGLQAKVNFPFLDGTFFTNSRENQTFDHIAYIADDARWPRGRHNNQKGSDTNGFDYKMFNFKKLFMDAGPGKKLDGSPDYQKFEHDLSDHMPIWLRMPLPTSSQKRYSM